MENLVIQVTNLKQFMKDVPNAKAPLRLLLSEKREPSNMVEWLTCHIDLMGLNINDHIVWLNWSINLQQSPFSGEFLKPAHATIYNLIPQAKTSIVQFLETCGYVVEDGRYGLSSTLAALTGEFECVQFKKQADDSYTLEETYEEVRKS